MEPPPEAVGALAIYNVAALVTAIVALERVGWPMLTRLNPVAVVILVEPETVMVEAGILKASRVAEAAEATVCVVAK